MFLGVLLLFDGGLLAIGNVLFLAGLTLVIGASKTAAFFARRTKIRGTVCFFFGIALVFMKRPALGMLLESFGFVNLFGYVVAFCTPGGGGYGALFFFESRVFWLLGLVFF
ncbi:MAG: hypothetical protein BJ554DRAFT_7911 [Olpidium bornovanus]|uniref:Uncharacterized protein n=1 Tax=Olpidium bornovanus TaxID=278681 RepID=A0A8H8DJ35_9FUNG|nr:MAG: hypothetical protein BJ554DRAFT_7911 [Olpidium bornovanus]